MNSVIIIANNYEKIKQYLEANMSNIRIDGFKDIFKLKERLDQAPIRADVIIMRDSAFIDSDTNLRKVVEAGAALYNILNGYLFEVKRIHFLSSPENEDEQNLMNFIKESEDITTNVNIHISSKFEVRYIKELLVRPSDFLDLPENEYAYVIRKRRNKDIGSNIIETSTTDKALISLYPEHNYKKEDIKEQLSDIYRDVKIKDNENKTYETIDNLVIDDIDVNIEKKKLPKVIAVMGESKSGCSTTALTIASTGATIDKTLLIDMNWTNLGLTFLTEKTLIKDEINTIKIEDLLTDKNRINSLKEKIFMKQKLHVITLTLPAKKIVSREEFGLLITNILNQVKDFYKFIVIDMPFDDLDSYTSILSKLDRIILCSPPYINNIVSLFERINSSNINIASLLKDKDEDNLFKKALLLRTRVFSVVNKNIKPISRDKINEYSENFLDGKLNITSIYAHSGNSYIDEILFRQIII